MKFAGTFLSVLLLGVFTLSGAATAQTTKLPFGGINHDSTQPIEIVSDSFSLDQNKGTAEFTGNVVVGQGDMRLAAESIHVEYAPDGGQQSGEISKMTADGNVTLVSGNEAAEAQRAIYNVGNNEIVLEGNVIMTQGQNAIAGEKVWINLRDGSARFEGRVKTVFRTKANP